MRSRRRSVPVIRCVPTVVLVIALAVAASLGSPGSSQASEGEEGSGEIRDVGVLDGSGTSDIDRRPGYVTPTDAQQERVNDLDARVRWTRFGTPASLLPRDGDLASGLPGSPVEVARGFLDEERTLFRLSESGVRDLDVVGEPALPGSDAADAHVVVFRQRIGGLPAGAGGLITVGVVGDRVAYVSSSAFGDSRAPEWAALSAEQAWIAAAKEVGRPLADSAVQPLSTPDDPRDWTTFNVAGMSQAQQVRLVAVGMPGDAARLAYEANVVDVQDGSALAWTSFVDAVTGAVLVRNDRTDHLLGSDHGQPASTGAATSPCRRHWRGCVRPLGFDRHNAALDAILGGAGTGDLGTPADGGSVEAVSNGTVVSSGLDGLPPPAGAAGTRASTYSTSAEFTDAWRRTGCDIARVEPGGGDVDAAIRQVFALNNGLHAWTHRLGFTAETYNLQERNAGAGLGRDPVLTTLHAGALSGGYPTYLGRNDANQVTLQDGLPTIASHYLFEPMAAGWYGPCVDGALDPTVVAHEYAHAVTSRMVAGPDAGVTSSEGRAVAESWSDLVATEYHLEYGSTGPDGTSPTAVGAYVGGNRVRGVRDYPVGSNPLTYADLGDLAGGPGDHAVAGEVWTAANWDLRSALAEKYAASYPADDTALQHACADGGRLVSRCPGNRRWVQLLLDSLLLQQGDVTMVDARDALLAADRMRFDGENAEEIWHAFAARGLGERARPAGTSGRAAVPDFTSPVEDAGTLMLTAAEGAGLGSVPATVRVGDRATGTPTADTDPTTPLPNRLELVPGRYDLTWSAPGYGIGHTPVEIADGSTRWLTLHLGRNLASAANGATTTGGSKAFALIDDDERTTWTVVDRRPDVRGAEVTVDLAGTRPRPVREVRVSALPRFAEANRFTALRRFALEACVQSSRSACGPDTGPGTVPVEKPAGVERLGNDLLGRSMGRAPGTTRAGVRGDAGWQRFYTSPEDAFPATRPRPVTPDLVLRTFDVPDVRATHLRLVVLENQCTGNPAYHLEQEADPLATSDCLASRAVRDASVAELAVYGSDEHTRRPSTHWSYWN